PLGEEPALGYLGLALPIDVTGELLRPDLLAVLAAVLVRVAHPPDARALRALEDAPGMAPTAWAVSVACSHVRSPRPARTLGRGVLSRSPRESSPGRPCLGALRERSPPDTGPSELRRPSGSARCASVPA